MSLEKIFQILEKRVIISNDGTSFQIYDEKHRLRYYETDKGFTRFYKYDKNDNLLKFKNYNGHVIQLFYNRYNKIISMEDESGEGINVTYNRDYTDIDFLRKSKNLPYNSYLEMCELIYNNL